MLQIDALDHSCTGCGACSHACPSKAIQMTPKEGGFLFPAIDASACVNCGVCETVCPAVNEPHRFPAEYWAMRCNDADLLRKSTSGGAFSLLSEEILRQNGLVCGAVLDDLWAVRHRLSDNIAPMRKSKYIQSNLTEAFPEIETALKKGTKVLFTGTPCQCDAVRRVFNENTLLWTAALICRGVQSPKLWADYVSWLERNGKLTAYDFRAKVTDNDAHTVTYTINGRETVVSYYEDGFSRIYSKCLNLRPSCYQCRYSSPNNPCDFTIGDFWGVEKVYPELNDHKGVSLVITHTDRAASMLKTLGDQAVILPVKEEDALQPALREPAKEPMLHKFFVKDLTANGPDKPCNIEMMLKKYAR